MRMRQHLCWLLISVFACEAGFAQEPDLSKVEIKTTQLAPGLYLLEGGDGGNITASVGADGVLLVDDYFAPLADKIRAALTGVGATRPVRYVINTHYHDDHRSGNLPFAAGGAVIIAQDNVRARLLTGGISGNGGSMSFETKPVEPGALPQVTFDQLLTVHLNGEDARAVHYAAAHTDGDTIVFFPKGNAVAMGDIYVRYGFPFIDINGGGMVQGMIAACEDVLKWVSPEARIVPGHGEVASVADLRVYLKMLQDTSAAVAAALKAGKTLAQMKQEHILGPWSERYSPPQAFVDTDAFTETLYNSLKRHGALRR